MLAGDDADHFFATAPVAGVAVPARTWVIGDAGTASSQADAVRDAYLGFTGTTPTDVWLMLGDNAYPASTDEQYQVAVFETYAVLLRNTCLWPAIGNHDAISSDSPTQTGPFFEDFTLPAAGQAGGVASGTEAYYSYDHGNVHFVCLDTSDSDLTPTGLMLQWLVAYFHHPPYTKGSHDSDNPADSEGRTFLVRENLLPLLEAAGVDLVLAGHSHSSERSFLLHGHYGTSDTLDPATMILDHGDGRVDGDGAYLKGAGPAPGAVYVVDGSSGQLGGGPLNHPAMFIGLNVLGSVILDVNGERLDALFLDDSAQVRDYFTVETLPRSIFADGFESGTTAAWSLTVPGSSRESSAP